MKRLNDKSIKISQIAYLKKVLERFNFSNCKPVSTPMLKSPETITTGNDSVKIKEFPYRQLVGPLMYLMIRTRPDLSYSVGFISRSLKNPTSEDICRVKTVYFVS